MIGEIISYYFIAGFITWVYGWVMVFPSAFTAIRSYAVETDNTKLMEQLSPVRIIFGTLIGVNLFWWLLVWGFILNPTQMARMYYLEMAEAGDKLDDE